MTWTCGVCLRATDLALWWWVIVWQATWTFKTASNAMARLIAERDAREAC
jgi:hypothetical protein